MYSWFHNLCLHFENWEALDGRGCVSRSARYQVDKHSEDPTSSQGAQLTSNLSTAQLRLKFITSVCLSWNTKYSRCLNINFPGFPLIVTILSSPWLGSVALRQFFASLATIVIWSTKHNHSSFLPHVPQLDSKFYRSHICISCWSNDTPSSPHGRLQPLWKGRSPQVHRSWSSLSSLQVQTSLSCCPLLAVKQVGLKEEERCCEHERWCGSILRPAEILISSSHPPACCTALPTWWR